MTNGSRSFIGDSPAGQGETRISAGESKPAEEALRLDYEQLQLVQDAAGIGAWDWTPPDGEVHCSEQCRALFHFPPDRAITYEVFLGAVHVDDRPRIHEAVQRTFTTGERYDVEMRVVLPDGAIRWLSAKGRTFLDATGRPVRMAGIAFDATARKLAEQALRESEARAKEAEERLRRSEARYRALFENLPDAVFLTRADGAIAQVNPAACAMFRMPEEEILRVGPSGLIDPEDRRRAAAIEARKRNHARPNVELSYLRKDGERFTAEANLVTLPAEPGSAFVVLRDISERKRAAEVSALQARLLGAINRVFRETLTCETEEELGRTCLTVAEELTQSKLGFLAQINERTTRFDELAMSYPGRDARGMVNPQGHDDHLHLGVTLHGLCGRVLLGGKAIRTNDPAAHPESIGMPEGHPPLHAFLGVPLLHAGRTFGMVGLANRAGGYREEDLRAAEGLAFAITQALRNKRAERAMRESEQKFAAIYDNAPLAIALATSPDGRIVEINDAFIELFGYAREEAVGKTTAELGLPGSDGAGVADGPNPVGVRDRETVCRTRSGERRICSVSMNRVRILGREHLLSVVVDITERLRAEEALREVDRRKNEFLAVLSHELRNPLAPIRNSTYLLAKSAMLDERGRRATTVIERQVNHLTHLVDDLLDVTRISRGKIRLQRSRVDLAELVRRAVEDHRTVLELHEVGVALPREQTAVDGDPTRLAQVVGNLLQNAAKFTPRGGRIDLTVKAVGGRAVLEVADTGVGIEREMLGRLFVPFMQADRSLDRSLGGLGLGLAFAKGIVELHGGAITADSEGPGRGARFVVSLPLEGAQVEEERADGSAVNAAVDARGLLIIEDNRDAADSLAEVLELAGYRVSVAYSGTEGLEKARAVRPEIVLCDIGLPGMDGYAVARALRLDSALGSAFLVALTGYAQPEDERKALNAGFDAHMAKPPDLEALVALLREAPLEGSQQDRRG